MIEDTYDPEFWSRAKRRWDSRREGLFWVLMEVVTVEHGGQEPPAGSEVALAVTNGLRLCFCNAALFGRNRNNKIAILINWSSEDGLLEMVEVASFHVSKSEIALPSGDSIRCTLRCSVARATRQMREVSDLAQAAHAALRNGSSNTCSACNWPGRRFASKLRTSIFMPLAKVFKY